MPASRYSMAMGQLHKRGTTAIQPAILSQRRNSTKRRTALSEQAHNMPHWPGKEGLRRDPSATKRRSRVVWCQWKSIPDLNRA